MLLTPALPVEDPGAPEIRRLVADMIETMEDANGAGLAAPQVHVPLRLFVFRVPPGRDRACGGRWRDGQHRRDQPDAGAAGARSGCCGGEGCLSIPGLRAAVPRHVQVRYAGVDTEGQPVGGLASGFHAGVVQHEYDIWTGSSTPCA